VPAGLTWDLGYGEEEIELETEGILVPGQWDESKAGFHTSILTETNFLVSDDPQEGGTYDFVKAYPCGHVPMPANW
jgi:hypothetical protein